MAYKSGKGSVMTGALGKVVGLLLGLYVFDQILDAIWDTINASTYFSTAVTFAESLLPVIGILGVYFIIKRAISAL